MPNNNVEICDKLRRNNDMCIFELAKEYACRYMETISKKTATPAKKDLELLRKFEEQIPEFGENEISILNMLNEYGSPNTVSRETGRYFGFVDGGALPISLATRWLTDVWDQNAASFVESPIASKLEDICEKWLVELFNLPSETAAGFVTGSTNASFCALAAARNTILMKQGWNVFEKGLFGAPEIKVVLSDNAHASIFHALALLGIGGESLIKVKSDNRGCLLVDELPNLKNNMIVILQAGNVNTGAFEDFENVCKLANSSKAWVHIDGAFGLWAAASKKTDYLTKGIERADSWSVDGHKTLNIPYDCGIVLCKDRQALCSAMTSSADYFVFSKERDPMIYTSDGSRRARAIELWAAIKYLGRIGIEYLVNQLCENARYFAEKLSENGFTIVNDVIFTQVLVSLDDAKMVEYVLKNVQQSRVCWCGGTKFNGKPGIRISVCSWSTSKKDIDESVNAFVRARA